MIINMNGAKAPETPSPVLQEKTITPETLPTVVGADEGYDGLSQVTINPDTNLKAENIRSGKTIFGVDGTFVGEPVYTTTDLVKYCYENNKDIYGSISTLGMMSDFDVSYTSDFGGVIYNSKEDLTKRCAVWQEDNHFTMFNPDPRGSGTYKYSHKHKVVINSLNLDKIQVFAGSKNLTNSISAGTPVSVNTSVIIYPYTTVGYGGPAQGEDGSRAITYNGTGTVQYDVTSGSSGSLTMNIVLDTPITMNNAELLYYNTSTDSANMKSNMAIYATFLSTYVEW